MNIETENYYFKITSIQPFNKGSYRGHYLYGVYQLKEDDDYLYIYFLEISSNLNIYTKECLRRRSDRILNELCILVDPKTCFVNLNDEVLAATKDWYLNYRHVRSETRKAQ